MPTYEYQCNKCKHKFEAFQKISDQPLKVCPKCKGSVKRLISSGVGIIFKGSGFYTTDYRSREYKEKEKQEKRTPGPSCPDAGKDGPCKKCPQNKDGQ